MRRLLSAAALGSIAVVAWAVPAQASQMIAFGVAKPTLKVNNHGIAVVAYTDSAGRRRHVLAWHAVNARTPSRTVPQVKFKLDYSGGYGSFGTNYYRKIHQACGRYHGPALAHLVFACDAPDGSHWALQTWRRLLPDGGWPANPRQHAKELHLSHWTGNLPKLFVDTDWIYGGRYDHLFGYLRYAGSAVYGFSATGRGNPLDGYGRNVYVDVLNPAWGRGWYRFNSGLTHRPDGVFCLGMYALYGRTHPAKGSEYRATVMGPGVTPILSWKGAAPGRYNPAKDAQKNAELRSFTSPSDTCYATH
jgi:hypothetical protein